MQYNAERGLLHCEYCGYKEKVETASEKAERLGKIEYARIAAREKAFLEAEKARKKESAKGTAKRVLIGILVAAVVSTIGLVGLWIGNLQKEEYDPFENLQVTFSGKDGYGQCILKTDRGGVSYEIPEKGLSEGETITITAYSDTYRLTERSRTYTVVGLNTRLTEEEQVTDEIKAYIREQSEGILETSGDYDSEISYTPDAIYLVVENDKTTLLDVYTATITKGSYSRDYVAAIEYGDVYTENGIAPISYTNRWYFGHGIGIVLDETKDHGTISALERSYCGYFIGFKSETDLENEIKEEYPGAENLIRVEG